MLAQQLHRKRQQRLQRLHLGGREARPARAAHQHQQEGPSLRRGDQQVQLVGVAVVGDEALVEFAADEAFGRDVLQPVQARRRTGDEVLVDGVEQVGPGAVGLPGECVLHVVHLKIAVRVGGAVARIGLQSRQVGLRIIGQADLGADRAHLSLDGLQLRMAGGVHGLGAQIQRGVQSHELAVDLGAALELRHPHGLRRRGLVGCVEHRGERGEGWLQLRVDAALRLGAQGRRQRPRGVGKALVGDPRQAVGTRGKGGHQAARGRNLRPWHAHAALGLATGALGHLVDQARQVGQQCQLAVQVRPGRQARGARATRRPC